MSKIYKIVSEAVWAEACTKGLFLGAAIDLTDGYIHFSTASQAESTASKYFQGQTGLLLVALDSDQLGANLKWEPARGGDLFPHLYEPLRTDLALWAKPLIWNGSSHVFPSGWNA